MSPSIEIQTALAALKGSISRRSDAPLTSEAIILAEESICLETRNLFNAVVDRASFWDVSDHTIAEAKQALAQARAAVKLDQINCGQAIDKRIQDFSKFAENRKHIGQSEPAPR